MADLDLDRVEWVFALMVLVGLTVAGVAIWMW
jgi:hypothetical protein